ncbi:uncharacterized protein LOC122063765 [Macadamia integrifolia]|uniref:uncharacterized protein LOC122063765 n=1 Tax=Macadamia integrifolia TaxID=60698 RepID=UPI001C4E415D|nr:uncharacterized protein LOC122063765 [Macadamia integrifolia]
MSSIPELYTDYSFVSGGLCGISPYTPIQNVAAADVILGEETFPFFGNEAINEMTKQETNSVSPFFGMSYPEQLGFPAIDGGESGLEMVPRVGYPQAIFEVTGKCSGFGSDFPVYATRVEGNSTTTTVEEPNVKVGRYTDEERKKRILKYLKKRNRRNFNKTIKYACRKALADRRVRIRGRFARNNELNETCQEAPAMERNGNFLCEGYYENGNQIKFNGEEWLQEAVASLMYLPVFTDDLGELMADGKLELKCS